MRASAKKPTSGSLSHGHNAPVGSLLLRGVLNGHAAGRVVGRKQPASERRNHGKQSLALGVIPVVALTLMGVLSDAQRHLLAN